MHDEMQEPTEEEIRAALEEQMRQLRVEDVILQTVATLIQLGARRLGLAAAPGEEVGEERDIEQARLAIEAVRALLPLSPEEQSEAVRQALTQLQMAFARESQAGGGAPPSPDPPPADVKAKDEQARAEARSKIWTPPGA